MQTKAILRYARISPQKCRLVVDTIRGKSATLAVNTLKFMPKKGAKIVLKVLDSAIANVSTARSTLGATQNRFEHVVANLSVAAENLSSSESRVRDTDMSLEMVSFTRNQIMNQAGTAMLAQANQIPQSVLKLLQ